MIGNDQPAMASTVVVGAVGTRAVLRASGADALNALALLVERTVTERLAEQDARDATSFNATAEDIAHMYGVTAAWVREHSEALGGRRIGSGSKPRHRFNVDVVAERLAARRGSAKPAPQRPTRRRAKASRQADAPPLLRIKGRRVT